MNVLKNLFDNRDNLNNVNLNKDKKRNQKYDIQQNKILSYDDKELYIEDENGRFWMGEYGKKKIEHKNSRESTYIGYNESEGKLNDISIDFNNLFGNIALFGQSEYGKSTLMNNMMLQWINRGYGLCYIDHRGDNAEDLIRKIPSKRMDDVVYLNIGSKTERRVMVNLFDMVRSKDQEGYNEELETLTNTFVEIIKGRSDVWSNRTEYILETVTRGLIEQKDDFVPQDVASLLNDNKKIQQFIKEQNDIEDTFIKSFKSMDFSEKRSVIEIVENIENNRPMRQLIKPDDTSLDIGQVAENNKILIVDTSSFYSKLNKESATQLIISKIASSINKKYSDDENPFFLCVDELELAINKEFNIERVIRKSRNSKLCAFISAQQPSQLPKYTKDLVKKFSNILTFNIGHNPRDKKEISQLLGHNLEQQDISNLNKYKIVGKTSRDQEGLIKATTLGNYPPLRSFEKSIDETNLDQYKILR